jgi:hypothetical protein
MRIGMMSVEGEELWWYVAGCRMPGLSIDCTHDGP